MIRSLVRALAFVLVLVGVPACGDGRLSPQGGSITSVTAGTGATGGGSSGAVTVNVIGAAGGGLSVLSDSIGLVTTCSSGFALTWDGDSWECTDITTAAELGTGTGGRSARWSDTDTLATGAFTDDGTNAAISGLLTVNTTSNGVVTTGNSASIYNTITNSSAAGHSFLIGSAGTGDPNAGKFFVYDSTGPGLVLAGNSAGLTVTPLATLTGGLTTPANVTTTGTGDGSFADDIFVGDDSNLGDDSTDLTAITGRLTVTPPTGASDSGVAILGTSSGYQLITDDTTVAFNFFNASPSTLTLQNTGGGTFGLVVSGTLATTGAITENGTAVLSGAITDDYVPIGTATGNLEDSTLSTYGSGGVRMAQVTDIAELTVGDVNGSTGATDVVWSALTYSDGNIYIDSKVGNTDSTIFRTGHNTEAGSTRTWLTVTGSNGNAAFGAAVSTANGLTAGDSTTDGHLANGNVVVADGAGDGSVPLDVRGYSDATGRVVARLSSQTSGSASFISFSDGFTYNFGIGTDTSGNLSFRDEVFSGSAGTERMRISTSDGTVTAFYNASVDGDLTAGNATTDAHTFNGTVTHTDNGGTSAYALTTTPSAATSNTTGFDSLVNGTANATASDDNQMAVKGTVSTTRSSGANNVNNWGGFFTASGGQYNVGVEAFGTQRNFYGSGDALIINNGNSQFGDSTSADSHTINGSTSLTSTAANNAFASTYSGAAQTADRVAINAVNTASFDTTAAARAAYAIIAQANVTRSAGSNFLNSYGVWASAAGAVAGTNIATYGEATSSSGVPGYGGHFIANGAGPDYAIVANGNDYNFYGENTSGALFNAGSLLIDGSSRLGADGADVLDANGRVRMGDTATSAIDSNLDVLTVANTGTGQTTTDKALIQGANSGSYSTAGGNITVLGINMLMSATESAGSNALAKIAVRGESAGATDENYGGQFVASGGTLNIGLTASGTQYSVFGSAGTLYNAGNAQIDGIATLGNAFTDDGHTISGTTTIADGTSSGLATSLTGTVLVIDQANGTPGYVQIRSNSAGGIAWAGTGSGGDGKVVYTTSSNAMQIATANTFRQTIDASGSVFFGDTASTLVSSNVDVLTIGQTGTGMTTSGLSMLVGTNSGSYNTTSAALSARGITSNMGATRSAGSNTFDQYAFVAGVSSGQNTNIGFFADASGATNNYSFYGAAGMLANSGQVWFGDTSHSAIANNLDAVTVGQSGTAMTTSGIKMVKVDGQAAVFDLATDKVFYGSYVDVGAPGVAGCGFPCESQSGFMANVAYLGYADDGNENYAFFAAEGYAHFEDTITVGSPSSGVSALQFADDGDEYINVSPTFSAITFDYGAFNASLSGSYNTTSEALESFGFVASVGTTRSSGSNALTNYGAWLSASGGQVNYALWTDAGSVNFEGTTTVNDTLVVTGNIALNGSLDVQTDIANSSGSVQIADSMAVSGSATFNGVANTFGDSATDLTTFSNGPAGINTYAGTHLEMASEWTHRYPGTSCNGTYIEEYYCSGSGANNAIAEATGVSARVGVASFDTGTATTGVVWLSTGTSNVGFSDGNWTSEATVAFPTLSTSGEEYSATIGFEDTFSNVDHVDGCYFLYDRGAVQATPGTGDSDVTGDRWKIMCASNSTRTGYDLDGTATQDSFTSVNSPVAAATYYRLKIVMEGTTKARFYINGTEVGRITSNIPSGSTRVQGFGLQILKSAGTTSRSMYVDQTKFAVDLTTAR